MRVSTATIGVRLPDQQRLVSTSASAKRIFTKPCTMPQESNEMRQKDYGQMLIINLEHLPADNSTASEVATSYGTFGAVAPQQQKS